MPPKHKGGRRFRHIAKPLAEYTEAEIKAVIDTNTKGFLYRSKRPRTWPRTMAARRPAPGNPTQPQSLQG